MMHLDAPFGLRHAAMRSAQLHVPTASRKATKVEAVREDCVVLTFTGTARERYAAVLAVARAEVPDDYPLTG